MVRGYITYASARSTQAADLGAAIVRLSAAVREQQAEGAFVGPGPIFVGIGASLAAAAAPVWELRSRGIHSWRLGAGDHPIPFPSSQHPVIAISQSGKSAETLAVLAAMEPGLRYSVVNNDPSPLAEISGRSLCLGNILDSYASTIGYNATVAALGMIADAWDGGRLDEGWSLLPERFTEVEAAIGGRIDELADVFVGSESADFVGSGSTVGSAEAGALLFREIARIPSTAMGTRQYLHGSMESAGTGVHVVLGEAREIELATTLASAGHKVILLTSESVAERANLRTVTMPALPAAQRSVLDAVVMQHLVAAVAAARNIEIEEFVFHNSDTKVETAESVPTRSAVGIDE